MRRVLLLNRGWRFHLGEVESAFNASYDAGAWREITIPHDWSVEAPFDRCYSSGTGYLQGGVGWYRLNFTLDFDTTKKHCEISFAGIYQNSRVWLNGYYLGIRPYGYSSFSYDVSGIAKQGVNTLCVRCEHINLADSRWFTGAGIYRDVTFTATDECYIKNIFARTASLSDSEGVISITVDRSYGDVKASLTDADGKTVAFCLADSSGACALKAPSPRLWSPDDPYLYKLTCELTVNGETVDALDIPFGIRAFSFDVNAGFSLNGSPMKLKGVCVHHDAGALGAAVPTEVWRRRIKKLKSAGCNALRASHNPPDPLLLDLCDEMGLLVIDEAFDEWEGCKNKWWQGHNVYPPKHYGYSESFPAWHERDLRDMIIRDRNHPCVIMWSIGNEIDYPNDPYVHKSVSSIIGNNDLNKPVAELQYDAGKPDAGRLPPIARELKAIIKSLDDSRPVTMAIACPEISNITGLCDVPDVVGYNYKEALYDSDHKNFPNRVLFGSENSTSYDAWRYVRDNDYISGQFLWTGIDFLGEARGWPIRISQAGILDIVANEKPLWHMRRALWLNEPVAKLAVGTTGEIWDEIVGWDFTEGENVKISCYTNAEWAEAFINGKSLGRMNVPENARCVWSASFERGELTVKCGSGEKLIEDRLVTPGAPERLTLECEMNDLPADGRSVRVFDIRITDANGVDCVTKDDEVTVQVLGDIELLGIDNANPADLTPYTSDLRKTYRGRAVAYVRAGELKGRAMVYAYMRGGLSAEYELTLR